MPNSVQRSGLKYKFGHKKSARFSVLPVTPGFCASQKYKCYNTIPENDSHVSVHPQPEKITVGPKRAWVIFLCLVVLNTIWTLIDFSKTFFLSSMQPTSFRDEFYVNNFLLFKIIKKQN